MLERVLKALALRQRWAQIGVKFFRASDFKLDRVVVAGKKVRLRFPDKEKDVLNHELKLIYYQDCYRLEKLSKPPATIGDIGGNVGLFSLVARHHFPNAKIHCYEPNRSLRSCMESNLGALDIDVFNEGVGPRYGKLEMRTGENSLHSVSVPSDDGTLLMVPLERVVERLGGKVDLLKMDCEGAEWEVFESDGPWEAVREITMEYHLWARPGSSLSNFIALLEARRFAVLELQTQPGKTWGLIRAKRF